MPLTTTPTMPSATALDDPRVFAHCLFANMADDAGLLAPLDPTMDEFAQIVLRLRDLLAEQPEAKALLFRLDDLCGVAAIEAHTVGIEFGVAAEQLRISLRGSLLTPWQPE